MSNEFSGRTLREALAMSTARERAIISRKSKYCHQEIERKGSFDVWAPPLFWGPWVILDSVFAGNKPREKWISYQTQSSAKSSFDIEIRSSFGKIIRDVGPGSTLLKFSANSVNKPNIRAKSHSLGQHIRVTMS